MIDRLQYVRTELAKKGFAALPQLEIQPDAPGATPVVLLTNCCIYPFDEGCASTKTKTYYSYTGQSDLLNITAAVALKLIEKGIRVILHLPEGVEDRVEQLFRLHPRAQLVYFLRGDIYSSLFVETVYSALQDITKRNPVSRLDLCLYDSYAAGLKKPFIPMFEDSPEMASTVAGKRITFLFAMSMMGYDLLLNKGQREFRLVCPSALATRRPSSHLFTDAIHKVVANTLLTTLAHEMPYYAGKPTYIVEIAPGMVDTGIYDNLSVREYVVQEALIDGFPMDESVNAHNIETWPMMSVEHVAQVTYAYLTAKQADDVAASLDFEIAHLTLAGRSKKEFMKTLMGSMSFEGDQLRVQKFLPDYCYSPGVLWGGLPQLKPGYVVVMMTPQGQYF